MAKQTYNLTPRDKVISELLQVYNKNKQLTLPLIEIECSFSRRALRTHFGSLQNFMNEFNLENQTLGRQESRKGKPLNRWTKEQVILKLKQIELEHGYVSKTLLETIKSPTPKVIYRLWNNFENMYSREELILELMSLFSKYGNITYDIIKIYSNISYSPFFREFGSIENMHKVISAKYKREHYLSKSAFAIIKIAEEYLEEKAILEFKDNRVKNPKTNRHLRVDAYFAKHNLAVEIHGLQHYSFKSHFFKIKKQFKYRLLLDRLKRMQLKKYGYKYLEIKYSLSENTIIQLLSTVKLN
jgi:hypothetical protein